MAYYILCSYPNTHVDTTSDDIDVIRDRCSYLAGEIDEELYFWVEMDCPKHGRQQMTNHCECQVCDTERAREEEEANKADDARFNSSDEYMC